MKLLLTSIISLFLFGCYPDKVCNVEPLTKNEVLNFRDSLGIISSTRFKRYDITKVKPLTFIRYLSSVDVFQEINQLEIKGFQGKINYTPFMLEPKVKRGWVNEESKAELIRLICSKQPAVPTMNRNAASLPDKLSTVGIEAMHLLYYSEGNEAVYVSNRAFCTLEKQDSMIVEYLKKYK